MNTASVQGESTNEVKTSLVFWQPIMSPHVFPLLRALAGRGCRIQLIIAEGSSRFDQAMGWGRSDDEPFEVVPIDDLEDADLLTDAWHIVSGVHFLRDVLPRIEGSMPAGVGLYSEPWSAGWLSPLRAVRYAWASRGIRRRVDVVLATGQRAIGQFEKLFGVHTRVVPFGYFTPGVPQRDSRPAQRDASAPLRIVCVSRLIPLKKVDALIRAVKMLDFPADLTVVGEGPERKKLEHLVSRLQLGDSVHLVGSVPHAQVPDYLADADVAVLASRNDGWGAVVNEALLAGTPVIVSTGAGAFDLVRPGVDGWICRPTSRSLRAALTRQHDEGPFPDRAAFAQAQEQRFGPEAAADYLLDVLAGRDVVAPWRPVA